MHVGLNQRLWQTMIVNAAICLMALNACGLNPSPTPGTGSALTPTPQPEALPEWLVFAAPAPGSSSVGRSNPWAILKWGKIVGEGESIDLESFKNKVEFLLDGGKMDTEVEEWFYPDEISITGLSKPPMGDHQVTIRVQEASGRKLECAWSFTILDKEPQLPGLPSGVQGVRPLPGSTISLREYDEEPLLSFDVSPLPGEVKGQVCVSVYSSTVDATQEGLDYQDYVEKLPLSLDGVSLVPSEVVTDGPHLRLCSRSQPMPGIHYATVELQEPTGVVTYTWSFTITEDTP